jgi:hypothetical protein
MPLATEEVEDTGPALPANKMNTRAQQEVSYAIGKITAGNMFGKLGTISGLDDINGWRVDRQNAPSDTVNISIQRNGVPSPSTVATVFVPVEYNLSPPRDDADQGDKDRFQARIKELERTVRRGLEESFNTYRAPSSEPPTSNKRIINRFKVTGVFSA